MYLRLAIPVLWLADFTLAKPVANSSPLRPRQVVSELTFTSAGTTAQSDLNPPPLCIVTTSVSPDELCSAVAKQYGIPLSVYEANSLAMSDDCRYLLEGYRVCIEVSTVLTISTTLPIQSSTSGLTATSDTFTVTRTGSSDTQRSEEPSEALSTSTTTESPSTTISSSFLSVGATTSPQSSITSSAVQSPALTSTSSSRVEGFSTIVQSTATAKSSFPGREPTVSPNSTQTVDATLFSTGASQANRQGKGRTTTVTITTCSRKPVVTASWNATVLSTRGHSGSIQHMPSAAKYSLSPFNVSSPVHQPSIQSGLRTVTYTQGTGSGQAVTHTGSDTTTITIAKASLAARSADLGDSFPPHWHAEHSQDGIWQNSPDEPTCVESFLTVTTFSTATPAPVSTEPFSASQTDGPISAEPLSGTSFSQTTVLSSLSLYPASGTQNPTPSVSSSATSSSTSSDVSRNQSATFTSISVPTSVSSALTSARSSSAVIQTSVDNSSAGSTQSTASGLSSTAAVSFSTVIASASALQTSKTSSILPVTTTGSAPLSTLVGTTSTSSTATVENSPVSSTSRETTSVHSSLSTDATASTTTQDSSQACLGARAVAPAPTQTGIIAGCTLYYVAQTGDDCTSVAEKFDISVNTFITWNPAVGLNCSGLMTDDAYCVNVCESTSTSIVLVSMQTGTTTSLETLRSTLIRSSTTLTTAFSTSSSALTATDSTTLTAALPTSSGLGVDVYKTYTGNGSVAAGWPSMDHWVSFEYMFETNSANMEASCAQWGVTDDSDSEVSNMRAAILAIAADSGVDARFILATIMQESTGCVRVITTEYSVFNPGLMQSHNGTGTCNTNSASLLVVAGTGVVQTPCPASEIRQMIADGVEGTSSGDGLEQLLVEQGHTDVSRWYRTARLYNGGSIAASGDLEEGCCTLCYASDIANRLTGWVNAEHGCTL